ncbi:hypothetical protein ACFQY4_34225 [Catellatospora bangladeshensis]|uniref:Uncharacterized protein n=1 Tax=Catellatospora bangladeshensis TaxID=310355 RepID=A0A8J3JCH1_9ACTN|nr:hypothetical protein [Catellatospora bangladeshensis]GIF82337.1 hypothetical protein Cba03nite_36860 [Catellatospora bangladeshensis]
MGRALTAEQFEAYARRQINTALDILDHHHDDLFGLCACGRPRPCSVVATCQAAIAHYRAKLALVGATQPMRTVMRQQSSTVHRAERFGLPAIGT